MPKLLSIRRFLLLCAVGLAAANVLAWHEYALQPDGRLHAYFLDVNQGDATLLVTPTGKQILIDGGPALRTLEHLGDLLPFFDRTIDVVVLTHPDADHLTALPDVLQRYGVGHVVLAGTNKQSARYREFIHEVETQQIPVVLSKPGRQLHLGDGVIMRMLWPDAAAVHTIDESNNASVTLLVQYGDTRLLLPGDIEMATETALLASGIRLQADVLKVPHHGSRTSSSTGFLLAVQPDVAIVSAGEDNSFGHPHPDVLARYDHFGIPIRSTAKEGTISLQFE